MILGKREREQSFDDAPSQKRRLLAWDGPPGRQVDICVLCADWDNTNVMHRPPLYFNNGAVKVLSSLSGVDQTLSICRQFWTWLGLPMNPYTPRDIQFTVGLDGSVEMSLPRPKVRFDDPFKSDDYHAMDVDDSPSFQNNPASAETNMADDFVSFAMRDPTRSQFSRKDRAGLVRHVAKLWGEFAKNLPRDQFSNEQQALFLDQIASRISRVYPFIYQTKTELPSVFTTDMDVEVFIERLKEPLRAVVDIDALAPSDYQALVKDLKRMVPIFRSSLLKYQTTIPVDSISTNIATMFEKTPPADRRETTYLYNFLRTYPKVRTVEQIPPAIQSFIRFNKLPADYPKIKVLTANAKQYVKTFYNAVQRFVLADVIAVLKQDVETLSHEVCGNFAALDKQTNMFYYGIETKNIGHSVGAGCETRGKCDYTKVTNYMYHTHPLSCYAYPSLEDIRKFNKRKIEVMLIFNRWGVFALRTLPGNSWPPLQLDKVQSLLDTLGRTTRNAQYKSIPWDEMQRSSRINAAGQKVTRQEDALKSINTLKTLLALHGISLDLDTWGVIDNKPYPLNMDARRQAVK